MTLQIDSAFPGGNIVVERVEGDEVIVHQDLRDTPHDWFYWCLRARGAAGRTFRFSFTQGRAIGVRGPAVSGDKGMTWSWLGSDSALGNSFLYTFPEGVDDVRLSFAMPYQEAHWQRFVTELSGAAAVSCRTLCTTGKGRRAEYLLMGCGDSQPRHRVAVTCRHHCCEMMADYVLEGLVEWVLEGESADSQWMRECVELLLVPFVDKDGVEDGDQGKGRHPRDHGRDYAGKSIHATTGAIRALVPEWSGGHLRVGLDLHCPHISGPHNEVIYLVGSADKRVEAEQRRFGGMLESAAVGPLPFVAGDFLPFGQSWNTGVNYTEGKGFGRWVADLPGVVLGTAIEIPYANAGGAEVNQSSARLFGADLGRGLAVYLHSVECAETQNRNRS